MSAAFVSAASRLPLPVQREQSIETTWIWDTRPNRPGPEPGRATGHIGPQEATRHQRRPAAKLVGAFAQARPRGPVAVASRQEKTAPSQRAYLRRNLSTRPAVSTIFCLPV